MKALSSAVITTLLVLSGPVFAEKAAEPVTNDCRDAVLTPSSQESAPFDLNHMGTGSDKSDALGVAYYH